MSNDFDKKDNLLELIRQAEAVDEELREKFQIGDKFRFIRDRIKALTQRVEESMTSMKPMEEAEVTTPTQDEIIGYIYLFNAQGLDIKSWQKMLNPAVYYEYSVNRPIYTSQADIDAMIRTKTNKAQHGSIAIRIHKNDILNDEAKDALGNTLIKVREGSLKYDQVVGFTHNGQQYKVGPEQQLIKKD